MTGIHQSPDLREVTTPECLTGVDDARVLGDYVPGPFGDYIGKFMRVSTKLRLIDIPQCTNIGIDRRKVRRGLFTFGPSVVVRRPHQTPVKLKYLASVETSAGTFINDTLPEETAATLRAVLPHGVPDLAAVPLWRTKGGAGL